MTTLVTLLAIAVFAIAISTIALLAMSSFGGTKGAGWQIAAALHKPFPSQAAEGDRSTIIKLVAITGTLNEVTAGRIDKHLATRTVDHRHSLALANDVITVGIIISADTFRFALRQSDGDRLLGSGKPNHCTYIIIEASIALDTSNKSGVAIESTRTTRSGWTLATGRTAFSVWTTRAAFAVLTIMTTISLGPAGTTGALRTLAAARSTLSVGTLTSGRTTTSVLAVLAAWTTTSVLATRATTPRRTSLS